MARCSDLPKIAVERILRKARGRLIAGANTYACVCRQWRDVSGEEEPLQLFLNLAHLSEKDLARATSWLVKHGQHVDVLVIQKASGYLFGWHLTTAAALHRLQRLEISEVLDAASALHLSLALLQMPQLQHLAMTLEMRSRPDQEDHGVFRVSADLRALCPQLTSLALNICAQEPSMRIDPAVSQLFSRGLEQLTVADAKRNWGGPVLCASSLAHLRGLRQLTLDGVELFIEAAEEGAEVWEEAEDSEEEAQQELERTQQQQAQRAARLRQQLASLQQLRRYNLHTDLREHAADLVALAPYLVEYEMAMTCQDVSILSSCVHLTRLVLYGDKPEGLEEALAALTGLQELGMQADMDRDTAAALWQQGAAMPHLRGLQLVGSCMAHAELAFVVGQCSQLTSLVLFVRGPYLTDVDPWWATLQQLTGLRRLTVPEWRLKHEQGSWVSHLTALTCLCVELSRGSRDVSREGYQAKAQRLVEGVAQQWPAQLQQVMFWVDPRSDGDSFQPMWWQFTPPTPGSAAVTVWLEEPDGSAAGWARPLCPCPHLPGVWELQGEVAPEGRAWYYKPV
jgi:HPt (histidine-containing phosphotransfer) domain-containing protein